MHKQRDAGAMGNGVGNELLLYIKLAGGGGSGSETKMLVVNEQRAGGRKG